ncbi:MAG: hypothetical protein VKJ04_09970 [Vampirovibrionales bacterium]|nr:hypothetical protein [Vampirovibrionales bacterium]
MISTLRQFRLVSKNQKGWIPIPKRFIQDKFRGSNPRTLAAQGLVKINRHYIPGKKPRQYKVADWVIDGYIGASLQSATGLLNLWTGKPVSPQTDAVPLETPPDDIPNLIQEAMACFTECWYNPGFIELHLAGLREEYQSDPTISKRFRYLNDSICYDAVFKHSYPHPTLPGIRGFKPAYALQSTGRIGTPFQSCSRSMKRAAFGTIPHVYNYDLASCQINLSLYQMRLLGIECPWLVDYLENKSRRAEYAAQIKITEDSWKACLCSVLFGAVLPTHIRMKHSSIIEILEEDPLVNGNLDSLAVSLACLRKVLHPLQKPLKTWHQAVIQEVVHSGFIVNHVGLRREYADFQNKTSGIIAHLLQGMEAYFIHTLTHLGAAYGFIPMGNEHDGLITIGCIPPAAIEKAKEITGLAVLELREKPFIINNE